MLWSKLQITKDTLPSIPKGYTLGGVVSAVAQSYADVYTFATDTIYNLSNIMASARYRLSACNSNLEGLAMGGFANVNQISGITFSSETATGIVATLSQPRAYTSALSSSVRGYACGGNVTGSVTTVDGLVFSSHSAFTAANSLSTAKQRMACLMSGINGYLTGGYTNTNISTITKMIFASETFSDIGTLSENKNGAKGVSNTPVGGYTCGGFNSGLSPSYRAIVEELLFSTENTSTLGAVLAVGRAHQATFTSTSSGYSAGGSTSSGSYNNSIEAFNYVSKTSTSKSATLTNPIFDTSGCNILFTVS
jgi:hypothetical protein